jgi:hypothetical protein
MLVPQGLTNAPLVDSSGDYHLQSFEHENSPLSILPIQYSPLFLSCCVRSQIHATLHPLKEIQS